MALRSKNPSVTPVRHLQPLSVGCRCYSSAIVSAKQNSQIMKRPALTNNQRQKQYQWRKKQRLSCNEDRQRDTIRRISKAVAALEGQTFSNQTQTLAALTAQCWETDVIKPAYTTFQKHKHLWIHLIEGEAQSTKLRDE